MAVRTDVVSNKVLTGIHCCGPCFCVDDEAMLQVFHGKQVFDGWVVRSGGWVVSVAFSWAECSFRRVTDRMLMIKLGLTEPGEQPLTGPTRPVPVEEPGLCRLGFMLVGPRKDLLSLMRVTSSLRKSFNSLRPLPAVTAQPGRLWLQDQRVASSDARGRTREVGPLGEQAGDSFSASRQVCESATAARSGLTHGGDQDWQVFEKSQVSKPKTSAASATTGARGLRIGAIAAVGLVALGACQPLAAHALSLETSLLQSESTLVGLEASIGRTAFQLQQSTSEWSYDWGQVQNISSVWNFADGTSSEPLFKLNWSFETPREPSPPVKRAEVVPLAQSNSISCGQTSVAMAVNSLKGTSLRDTDIHRRYGFGLLGALNAESASVGVKWKDAGNFSAPKWPVIEGALKQRMPVVIGLNGPEFSPTGRGHIVTIVAIEGDKVSFADPAKGVIRETSRRNIERAPAHPHGKFLFVPSRTGTLR